MRKSRNLFLLDYMKSVRVVFLVKSDEQLCQHSFYRCEGIGSRNFDVLMHNLKENHTLVELNFSHNGLAQSGKFVESLAVWLGVSSWCLAKGELQAVWLG